VLGIRAKAILAVAGGADYQVAAFQAGQNQLTVSHGWWDASMKKGCRLSNRDMLVAPKSNIVQQSGNAFCAKTGAKQSLSKTEQVSRR
jgi:hypothetical protein